MIIIFYYFLVGAIYDLNVGIEHTNGVKPDLIAIKNGLPLKAVIY